MGDIILVDHILFFFHDDLLLPFPCCKNLNYHAEIYSKTKSQKMIKRTNITDLLHYCKNSSTYAGINWTH